MLLACNTALCAVSAVSDGTVVHDVITMRVGLPCHLAQCSNWLVLLAIVCQGLMLASPSFWHAS